MSQPGSGAADCWARNLAALGRCDPALARVLCPLTADPPEVEPTRDGAAATIAAVSEAGARVLLHSRYDPWKEARRWAAEVDVRPLETYFVFGLGLGYHVQALLERGDDTHHYFVLEDRPERAAAALRRHDWARALERGRLRLLVACDRMRIFGYLRSEGPLLLAGPVRLLPLPAYQDSFPARVSEGSQIVRECVQHQQVMVQTTLYLARRNLRNRLMNLRDYARTPDLSVLRGRFAGYPAVICSAGPSLQRNIDGLRGLAGRAVVVAVGTALRPLLARGIAVDYATAIDYSELSARYLEGLDPAQAPPLLCDPKANYRAVAAYGGPRWIVSDETMATLAGPQIGPGTTIQTGGTVAQFAYFLAEFLGCDPLIFVGQDLSYSRGLIHVPGTAIFDQVFPELNRFHTYEMREWDDLARRRAQLRAVGGWGGGEVYTDEVMVTYLRDFELLFAHATRGIINATEGGARIAGARELTLTEALERYAARPIPAALCPRLALSDLAAAQDRVRVRMAGLRDEARRFAGIAEKVVDLLARIERRNEVGREADDLVRRVERHRRRIDELQDLRVLARHLAAGEDFMRMRDDRSLDASTARGVEKQLAQARRDKAYVEGLRHGARYLETLLGEVQDLARSCSTRVGA